MPFAMYLVYKYVKLWNQTEAHHYSLSIPKGQTQPIYSLTPYPHEQLCESTTNVNNIFLMAHKTEMFIAINQP